VTRAIPRGLATALVAAAASAACSQTTGHPAMAGASHDHSAMTMAAPAPASGGAAVNAGDVAFMSGMIPHHAQAVIMAGWAPTHGARADVAILCERIVVGQRDEIKMMQTWLADRGLPVPDATSTRMKMRMDGMEHEMLMPGMLTDEEMAALDRARGPEFDRLFLVGMIRHHQGAIDMVDELMKAPGAAQDEKVFRFSADVFADQSTEIAVMQKMLESGRLD